MFKQPVVRYLSGIATLLLSSQAIAALPSLTVNGSFYNSPVFIDQTPGFINLTDFNSKPFELDLHFLNTPDYSGDVAITGLPGEVVHEFYPGLMRYDFKVAGQSRFSGTSSITYLDVINDVTFNAAFLASIPPGLFFPPVIQAGHTYDGVILNVGSIPLGCVDGGTDGICNQPGDVFEYLSITFSYVWDTAVKNAIDGIPNDFNGLPADLFTSGQGYVDLYVSHFVPPIHDTDIAAHAAAASSVTLAMPVPEAETWALMLAGLGLVGWQAMRRRMV